MSSDGQDDADNRDVEEKSRNSESEYDEDDERTESAYGTAVDSEKAEGTERYGGAVGKSDQDCIDQERSALTDNFAQFASADHESLANSLSYLDQQLATLHSLRVMSDQSHLSVNDSLRIDPEEIIQYLRVNHSDLLRWIHTNRLWKEKYQGYEGDGTGVLRSVPLHGVAYAQEVTVRKVAGDRHCGWRALSWRLFGSERAWKTLRMITIYHAYQPETKIELHTGVESSYLDIVQDELRDQGVGEDAIHNHVFHLFEGDADHQCGIFELLVASHLMQFELVVLGGAKMRETKKTVANLLVVAECGKLRVSNTGPEEQPEPPPLPSSAVWIYRSGSNALDYHQDPVVDIGDLTAATIENELTRALKRYGTPKAGGSRKFDLEYSQTKRQDKQVPRKTMPVIDEKEEAKRARKKVEQQLIDQQKRREEKSRAEAKAKAREKSKGDAKQKPKMAKDAYADAMGIAAEASDPHRGPQPAAGLNAALGDAYTYRGKSTLLAECGPSEAAGDVVTEDDAGLERKSSPSRLKGASSFSQSRAVDGLTVSDRGISTRISTYVDDLRLDSSPDPGGFKTLTEKFPTAGGVPPVSTGIPLSGAHFGGSGSRAKRSEASRAWEKDGLPPHPTPKTLAKPSGAERYRIDVDDEVGPGGRPSRGRVRDLLQEFDENDAAYEQEDHRGLFGSDEEDDDGDEGDPDDGGDPDDDGEEDDEEEENEDEEEEEEEDHGDPGDRGGPSGGGPPGGDPNSGTAEGAHSGKKRGGSDGTNSLKMLELQQKLVVGPFKELHLSNEITTAIVEIKRYEERHLNEVGRQYPLRKTTVATILQYAYQQHHASVLMETHESGLRRFEAPVDDYAEDERIWREKYMYALLLAMPSKVVKRFEKLCRNSGEVDIADDASTVGGTNYEDLPNPFEPSSERLEKTMKSIYWCPESLWWVALLSAYRGSGKQRTALQLAIVPTEPKDRSPVSYENYETSFDRWRILIQQANQFRTVLPDPHQLVTYFEQVMLGGDSEQGVLQQYPTMRKRWENFVELHHLDEVRAGDLEKVQKLIGAFHDKIKIYMESNEAAKPKKKEKKKLSDKEKEELNALKEKKEKDKKGSKEKGAPKEEDKPPEEGKGKKALKEKVRKMEEELKAYREAKGIPKGQGGGAPGGGRGTDDGGKGGGWKQDYPNAFIPGRALADQPTIFFTTKMPDGYQRALCTSYILDGKCRFEAKGETCLYAQHGGHPQQPSKAMIEAVKKRAEDWTARKGKWNAKNGKFGGKFFGGKGKENYLKQLWDKEQGNE